MPMLTGNWEIPNYTNSEIKFEAFQTNYLLTV